MKAECLPDSRKLRMPRVSAAATSITGWNSRRREDLGEMIDFLTSVA
jgi:hypothetical protein